MRGDKCMHRNFKKVGPDCRSGRPNDGSTAEFGSCRTLSWDKAIRQLLDLVRLLIIGCVVFSLAAVSMNAATADTALDLLIEGEAALEDELFDLAQKKIEQGLKAGELSSTEKSDGTILLARAYHGQKRYRDMLALLADGRAQAQDTPQADAFDFWMALAYFEIEQWNQALACVKDYDEKYPASRYQPRVLRLRAWAYLKLGRKADAIECFTRFADRYGNSPEGPANLLDGSQALIAAGHLATARSVLEQLVALDLDDRIGQEGRSLLGRIYVSEQKWEQARQVVQPLIDRKNVPKELRASAFFCLADVAGARSNLVESLSLLDKAAERVSDPALQQEVNLRKGQLLLRMDKIDEGVGLVRGFVAAQSTNAVARDIHLQLAALLLARGLNDKALREFQNFLETFADPAGVFRAHLGKGWALLNLGRTIEAAASFERACAMATTPQDTAYCRFKVADCHFAGEQFKLAAESYDRVVAQFPETDLAGQALLQTAECRVRLGDLKEAERLYWAMADLDGCGPLASRAFLRLAELRQQQGAEAEARALYRLVLAQSDDLMLARARLGIAFIDYQLGRFPEALAGFKAVDQFQSANSVSDLALYMGGWCQARLGRFDLAATAFRDFVRRRPRSTWAADASFWLAEQDYNCGRYGQAESAWARLAQEYPQTTPADKALFWAGRAALQQNEFRRAKNHFSLLIKNYPTSEKRAEARFYQGQALAELGEFAGVILVMDEIIKQFPEDELAQSAWLRKGDSQFTLGSDDPKRYEEALNSYRQGLEWPTATELSKLQAEYKIGRCLEKAGRPGDAFEHYMKVLYDYFKYPELKPRGNVWLTRAAFNAAGIKEADQSWRKAAAIYQRVVDAGVPAGRDARARIDKIKADYWTYFY